MSAAKSCFSRVAEAPSSVDVVVTEKKKGIPAPSEWAAPVFKIPEHFTQKWIQKKKNGNFALCLQPPSKKRLFYLPANPREGKKKKIRM